LHILDIPFAQLGAVLQLSTREPHSPADVPNGPPGVCGDRDERSCLLSWHHMHSFLSVTDHGGTVFLGPRSTDVACFQSCSVWRPTERGRRGRESISTL